MADCVENMFYVREKPWHGLGTCVQEAPDSHRALIYAGLDWNVEEQPVFDQTGTVIPGYQANVRNSDGKTLGVVSTRYKVVQNREAFAFTDELLGSGVRYETAGSLQGGKKVWLLARMPKTYKMQGDQILPYLVFSNTHDGSGSIKIAMTPVRVVCNNTLNLALSKADRVWSAKHTLNIDTRLEEARATIFRAQDYMEGLSSAFDSLAKKKVSDAAVSDYLSMLLPIADNASELTARNTQKLRADIKFRYQNAPDLRNLDKNGYRFINAVSDFVTHAKPLRETSNFQENRFEKIMNGNAVIDRAYQLMSVA